MTRYCLSAAVTLVLGLTLMLTQPGCLVAAAAAGTGATVAYVRGDLETTIDAPPKAATDAAERALKALDVAVISKEATSLDGKVVGRTARDVKLVIVVKGESDKLSKVSVRVGTFGDSAMQNRVIEKIRQELGTTASSPSTQPASGGNAFIPTTQPLAGTDTK
jgi:hypothetical protein